MIKGFFLISSNISLYFLSGSLNLIISPLSSVINITTAKTVIVIIITQNKNGIIINRVILIEIAKTIQITHGKGMGQQMSLMIAIYNEHINKIIELIKYIVPQIAQKVEIITQEQYKEIKLIKVIF